MALQLDIEPVTEQLPQLVEPLDRMGLEPIGKHRVDRALWAAGQADDALKAGRVQPVELGRHLAIFTVEIGTADQPRHIAEADLVGRHQDDATLAEVAAIGVALLNPVFTATEIDGEFTAEQWLDALPSGLLGEFERAEKVVGVGNAERRLFVGFGELQHLPELQRPLQQ